MKAWRVPSPQPSPRKRNEGELGQRASLKATLSQIDKTRYALAMPQPLARIIDQLKREPSRTGSIVITVFGDAIVPRGGSVWLGTLLEFFEAIDIDSGVVRTAMSRLAADGWLEREKVGRNSFYRLVKKGRQTFDAATKHIYDPQPSDWTGRFELLLIGRARIAMPRATRSRMPGSAARLPGVWVAPSGVPIPEEAASAIRLEVSAEDDSGRRLLSESWPLDRTADAYLKFMKTFEPLRGWVEPAGATVGPGGLHRADPADPLLPPGGAARSAAPAGAVACGLAGQGGPRALRRDLSRAVAGLRAMARR